MSGASDIDRISTAITTASTKGEVLAAAIQIDKLERPKDCVQHSLFLVHGTRVLKMWMGKVPEVAPIWAAWTEEGERLFGSGDDAAADDLASTLKDLGVDAPLFVELASRGTQASEA